MSAERPLSISDIRNLLTGGTTTDQQTDVHSTLQPVEVLLSFSEDIVRFKHHYVHGTVASLMDSKKITMPVESRMTDILLRILNYSRTTLREEIDPSFDECSSDSMARLFKEHTLLPYVVRNWVVHLLRLGQSKKPERLNEVLPNTAMLAILERTLWTFDLPLEPALEMNKTALQVRQSVLPELSPAVLQTIINTAVTYEMMGKPSESAHLYWSATKTAKSLLGDYHPLPVELGFRFLSTTESIVETTRTDTMTHREEVYQMLITLLERQYGKTSNRVVEVRTMLAKFYEYIHEEEHASEIYDAIHNATVQLYGRESSEARKTSNQLRVVLGKAKPEQKIETSKDSIFDEDEDIHAEKEGLDIDDVSRRLKECKSERDFVELWREVSTICRSTSSTEWHEKNIDVATAYSNFLTTSKRSNEASAILSSISREYESHQAALSDSIMTRLSATAAMMKELGQYTAALSILKRTSHLYQSLKREDSSQYMEFQKQISTVTTEMIASSSQESHADTLEDAFRVMITNESRPVDAKILTIGRNLTSQYMEQAKTSEAIDIIKLVLHRTWPRFLTVSARDIELTTKFPKETTDFVELMVQCYSQQRQSENVERNLIQLYHAVLAADSVDFELLLKIQNLLVDHYDKHNFPEKSITILQQALSARKSGMGPDHKDTIKILYELGRRSRRGPSLDYYQQIVTYLNKDSEVCHPKAIEASIKVATTYREDGRYSDALPIYSLLWNTFVQKPKDHVQFGKAEFAEQLYERYAQCLQYTGAKSEVMYKVTTQYRNTVFSLFGAQSTLATSATLCLARICYSSDRHASEALTLYEEVSKHTTSKSESKSEVQHALSTLYTQQVITQSAASTTSETIERGRVHMMEQFETSVSKYGYSHRISLARLQEIAVLNHKQNESEAARKELTKATTEIVTKETSSTKMIEAAESLVQTFRSINALDLCNKIVSEMRRQVVFKDASNASSFGFDVTKYGRSILPFLAAMEYRISSDRTLSFSQIMADLTTEIIYQEDYRRVKTNGSLEAILMTASVLRVFLQKTKRQDEVNWLENDVGAIFTRRDSSKIKFESQASPRILMTAIMQWLGGHRGSSFTKAVVLASNESVERLMATQKFAEAYDVACCGFQFAQENGGYSGPRGISYGFNLAYDLAGIEYEKKCPDSGLRNRMFQLSGDIAKKVLDVCKDQGIDFAQVQFRELNQLVTLLGAVEGYVTLEVSLSKI